MDQGTSFVLFLVVMALGFQQWGKWLGGNKVIGSAAKKGAINVIGRLFK